MISIEKYTDIHRSLREELRAIWNLVYPQGIAQRTIEDTNTFLDSKDNRSHYLVLENGKLIGWSFTFARDGQNWFSILVHPNYQQKGIGKALVKCMQANNDELCGWMVDKKGYKTLAGKRYYIPLDFYKALDFFVIENCRFDSDLLCSVKIEWKKA